MSGAIIAQLIIALGPVALKLIPEIAKLWSTSITPEQVNTYCATWQKSYDEYIAEARAKQQQ
jgi:hypothetical protein